MISSSHLEHFESIASKHDEQRSKQHYYYALLLERLKYIVPEKRSLLELGCADGGQMMALKPSSAMGIDFSPSILKVARERYPEGRWIQADLTEKLPPIPATFEYIIGTDILGYLQDIQGAMENVARLCTPDTRVVLTKTNPFWGPLFRIASHLGLAQPRRYSNWISQKHCMDILDLAGFETIQSGKFCLLPLQIPFVSTLFNRVLAHLPILNRLCLVEYMICRRKPVRTEVHPSLSVIIPARNEKGNILPALQRMPRFPGALEVIFVEGNSSDGTWEEIQRVISSQSWPFEVRSYKQTGKGKGDAVRVGFKEAKNDLLMILDADLTVMPEELPRFYDILADRRAEYVHGTRLVYPMENQAMRPLNWLGNKFFSWTFSFLLGQRMTDTLCGTKCLWRVKYQELAEGRTYFGEFDPFGDYDLIFGASKLCLKISEIPVHYKNRSYGETQINRFRDGWLLLRMCWFAARKMYFL